MELKKKEFNEINKGDLLILKKNFGNKEHITIKDYTDKDVLLFYVLNLNEEYELYSYSYRSSTYLLKKYPELEHMSLIRFENIDYKQK
jgi:hypothetical protein